MLVAKNLVTIAALFSVYLVTVTLIGPKYWVQVYGVFASVFLVFSLAERFKREGPVYRLVVEVGKYSLIGYIGQIAILQLVRLAANRFPASHVVSAVSLAIVFFGTILLVLFISAAIKKSSLTKACYKLAFA